MQLVPQQADYLALVLLLNLLTSAIFWEELVQLSVKAHFWGGLGTFMTACIALDWIALKVGWWSFDEERILGVYVLQQIPIEELALFALIYVLAVSGWESYPE